MLRCPTCGTPDEVWKREQERYEVNPAENMACVSHGLTRKGATPVSDYARECVQRALTAERAAANQERRYMRALVWDAMDENGDLAMPGGSLDKLFKRLTDQIAKHEEKNDD